MIREIITLEHEEELRKISEEIREIDEEVLELLDDLKETLVKAKGVGLAAPQIGVLKRAAVIDTGEELLELINPKILRSRGQQIEEEGCLSVPEKDYGYVKRPMHVTVEAYDREGQLMEYKAQGLIARAFCHEIDHLDGILFLDKKLKNYQPKEEKA